MFRAVAATLEIPPEILKGAFANNPCRDYGDHRVEAYLVTLASKHDLSRTIGGWRLPASSIRFKSRRHARGWIKRNVGRVECCIVWPLQGAISIVRVEGTFR